MIFSKKKKKVKRFGLDRTVPQESRALWLHVDLKRFVNGLIFGILFAAFVMLLNLQHPNLSLTVPQIVSNSLLILITCVLYSLYLVTFENRRIRSARAIIAVGVISLLPIAAAVWFPIFNIPPFLIPITLVAFIFGIAYSERTAISVSFLLCLLVGLTLQIGVKASGMPQASSEVFGGGIGNYFTEHEGNLYDLMVILFAGAAIAALGCGDIRKRSKLLKVGLYSSAIQALLIGAICVKADALTSFKEIGWGFFNGLLSATLVSAALPIIESIFRVTTDISLLELSDQNHPLLRRLSLEAPGTYHHSLILGNLVEAAGEAIGANSLLLRVAAYYHDIGKINKPEYFVENEGMQGSMHLNLSSTMSTLIITAHTKDGVELAREGGLPDTITDLIQQHHGTSLVEFFYRQAMDRNDGKDKIDQDLFRHPGPKPQTKEAGILMLADSVESASRALPDPTPSRIGRQVHDIIQRKVGDGQLYECDLTLAEMHKVEQSLVRSLTSVFHGRIKYPEPLNQQNAGEQNGRRNRKQAASPSTESEGNRNAG